MTITWSHDALAYFERLSQKLWVVGHEAPKARADAEAVAAANGRDYVIPGDVAEAACGLYYDDETTPVL